jgi:hypothetical protein
MKRCRFTFLACMLVGLSGISPSDGQSAGQIPGGGAAPIPGGNDAIAQNSAIANSPILSPEFKVYRTIHAAVVAIDQPYVINRLGASQPEGMIFVLKSDLVPKTGRGTATFNNFKLRDGKRPRPLVLRMNVGDLLEIHFENWLRSLVPNDSNDLAQKRPFRQLTRYAGIHVNGLEIVPQKVPGTEDIKSDGSWVGTNPSGLLKPLSAATTDDPKSITYRLYARDTGTFLLTSGADTTVHQLDAGLFGAVNVQPRGAEWYRSQTTRCEMEAATLTENDLRELEQPLGKYEEPPKLLPDQVIPDSDQDNPPPADPDRRPRSLRTAAPGSRAQVLTKVFIDPKTGRIYSKHQQPLINYFAVFARTGGECPTAVENKPVLSMLKVTADPKATKFSTVLPDGDYNPEIQSLDNGSIPFRLRGLFNNQAKIALAPDATVARVAYDHKKELKFSWVVTNSAPNVAKAGPVVSGTTYLLLGIPVQDTAGKTKWTLTIQECFLELIYSDLTALITGPNAGTFPYSQDSPDFYTNPASPERRQPYREFTIIYHQAGNTVQAFPQWSNNNLFNMINAGMDQFAINYGIAAIGPEIVANRLGVGPMGNSQQPNGKSGQATAPQANQKNDSVDLKYEEFFLSSWAVGDPAMIVDVPANAPNQMVNNPDLGSNLKGKVEDDPVQFNTFQPLSGTRPTKAFYPDDPSNVYHSYMRDHTKMRVLHAGPGPAHVHHLHAHQWLKSPNSPEATYLDSQLILPGSAYTLEMTYNGSGNRNQTVGDSIFHCHFYPHFAKGMWSLWRVHDTFEAGTELDDHGVCKTDKPNRALPDGEIAAGTPTPALIPMPTLGMAPMPAEVQVTDLCPWYDEGTGKGRRIHVVPKNWAKIVKQFDADKDGTLNCKERETWSNAVEDAKKKNTDNKKNPGDPGYIWIPYALYDNPGYPFFIPGVGGHRPPHPPLDMAWKEEEVKKDTGGLEANRSLKVIDKKARWTNDEIINELNIKDPASAVVKAGDVKYLDGGLPRHLVLGGDIVSEYNTRWDFSKDFVKMGTGADGKPNHIGGLYAVQLPEDGTPVEKAAMRAHSIRTHQTSLPENGDAGNFILNGLPPTNGAPYADPSVTDDGNSSGIDRRYQAAVIQTDIVLNKKGWHYPQSRLITLWEDVAPTIANTRAPEPFFIRTATSDATELWHTNLVPNYYELDDFQVRTPTDVIGQHIHLVKFDVTSSDGGANGWNYEDGTFGPGEVRERIHAITNVGGLYQFDATNGYVDKGKQKQVAVWPNKYAYPKRGSVGDDEHGLFGKPPANQDWEGAMTTIQRWAIDPLLNWEGQDRTLRTVFTHDHLGPSTHQQVGLYAGVLVEPQGSQWYLPDGKPMNTRVDGGPTSWQAMIVTADPENSHREYAIEFQDMHLAYTADSIVDRSGDNAWFKPSLSAEPLRKLQDQIKDYNGANANAPAAFFIGQLQESVPFVIRLLQTTPEGDPVPDQFLKNNYFQNYGIPLDKNTKVYKLATGNPNQGSLGAQWLFVVPPGTDANGAPVLNGGDYYIIEANNPKVMPTVGNTGGHVTLPQSLSVYTPNIPPGFADPAHAVNPNPGDDGNLGTPRGPAQTANISNFNFGNGAPYASLVSTRANGTYSMNYRNEPVQLRVKSDPPQKSPETDLAFAFSSIDRKDSQLNVQPTWNAPISPGSPYKFPPPLFTADAEVSPQGTDPFTPLIRGYVGDDIQIRALVGAHLQPHAFSIHGVHWLSQPSYHNSGYRNVQSMGISEHYEMRFKMPSAVAPRKVDGVDMPGGADYFYSSSTGAVGLSNGLWGIIRSYDREVKSLDPLVNNPKDRFPGPIDYKLEFENAKAKNPTATQTFRIVATTAAKTLPDGVLTYNRRASYQKRFSGYALQLMSAVNAVTDIPATGKNQLIVASVNRALYFRIFDSNGTTIVDKGEKDLPGRVQEIDELKTKLTSLWPPHKLTDDEKSQVIAAVTSIVDPYSDPNAVLFVRESDLDIDGKLKNGVRVEPLILRAAAGDWIKVTLINAFPSDPNSTPFANALSFRYGNPFNDLPRLPGDNDPNKPPPTVGEVKMKISQQVGLHPQLLAFDVTKANGINVGFNPDSTVGPGGSKDYYWYAGEIVQKDGKRVMTPVEFGATNLVGADLILQTQFGLVGSLVVEPRGSTWADDTGSHAFSTVTTPDGQIYRECVLVMQNMVSNLSPGRETAANQLDGRDAGFGAVNYRTENFASRNIASVGDVQLNQGFAQAFSSFLLKRPADPDPAHPLPVDPETPVFVAAAGTPTRFRVVMPSTTSANAAAQPVVFALHGHGWQDEPYIKNATQIGHNNMAQFIGSQEVTVTQKYDIVIDSAGGPFQVPGDYLYQAFNQEQKMGIWGLFRVTPPVK